MAYIESGKEQGATVHLGGERVGKEGYFIAVFPTIRPVALRIDAHLPF